MGVTLKKRVEPVRSARVFTSHPEYRTVTVTEYSNTRVGVTYGRRNGTYAVFGSAECDWERVFRREVAAERAAGYLIMTETLFDKRA